MALTHWEWYSGCLLNHSRQAGVWNSEKWTVAVGANGEADFVELLSGVGLIVSGADETNPGVSVQAERIEKHPNKNKIGTEKKK
jgi:hypothetical protein